MKKVAVFLIALSLLFVLGCAPKYTDEFVDGLKAQISDLQSSVSDLESDLTENQAAIPELQEESKKAGYDSGYAEGYVAGFKEGEATGRETGYIQGKAEGIIAGKEEALTVDPVVTEPTRSAPVQEAQPASSSYTVYVTKTGTKYHTENCGYLKDSKIAKDINEAIAQGYEPCKKCRP